MDKFALPVLGKTSGLVQDPLNHFRGIETGKQVPTLLCFPLLQELVERTVDIQSIADRLDN